MKPRNKLAIAVGITPNPDAVNMDKAAIPGIDVVWDVEQRPWPFPDERFEEIQAFEIVAYIHDAVAFMDECWRVLQADGLLRLRYPLPGHLAWKDPAQVRPYTQESFDWFDPSTDLGKRYIWYTPRKWKIVRREQCPNPGLYLVEMRKVA